MIENCCITWIQHGDLMAFRSRSSVSEAVAIFADSLSDSFSDCCFCHRLMVGSRLVARQATYTGV